MSEETDIRALLDREAERCAALVADDIERLSALLTDDLVHIHTSGVTDDRQAYLHGVSERMAFLRVERGPLNVRLFGKAAVMTGNLDQTIRMRASGAEVHIRAMVTQVWTFGESGWRIASFQATRLD